MNNQEAKFILGAYRPDGRDAGDAMFGEALAQAERDPELRTWLERQRGFDAALSTKLQQIAPPPGLREAILAGTRVTATHSRRSAWRSPMFLAVAAAVMVLAAVTIGVRAAYNRPGAAELAAFALQDLAESHDNHVGHPQSLADVQAQLTSASLPLSNHLKLDLDDLRKKNCRSVRIAGREVFEICFQRDGTWYHLYAARRSDFAPGRIDPNALTTTRGQFASTAWSDGDRVYALVTRAGTEALRRVI
jgi:hypothetical protein